MKFLPSLLASLVTGTTALNSTYYNPVLSGWHSDPSCIQKGGTFYCVTSSFLSFPGLPVYASKDLVNWRLASYAWNNAEQLPGVFETLTDQKYGFWGVSIREHDGIFYVISAYRREDKNFNGTIFKSTNPFDPNGWSKPIVYETPSIDPDLFWDDDGKVYAITGGIGVQEIDLDTGKTSNVVERVWRGTGNYGSIEGPHVYKKDGWYYLMIAEGGTGINHSIVMGRSKSIYGPYENNTANPILTSRNTDSLFQTVGHGDLFQDTHGAWWGICLSIRSGPAYESYAMGRESVLFPVTWPEGEFPYATPISGRMSGWELPLPTRDLPGTSPFNKDPDSYDFSKLSEMPMNIIGWREPAKGAFELTTNGLKVVPSRSNVTGDYKSKDANLTGQKGLSFVGRKQTATRFTFSVDMSFRPSRLDQEAGVSLFVTQLAHIDLAIVRLPSNQSAPNQSCSRRWLRLKTVGRSKLFKIPDDIPIPVPRSWGRDEPIRLQIEGLNQTHYEFSANPANRPEARVVVGQELAYHVSGDTGSYVGALTGIYATCNGAGEGTQCPEGGVAHFNNWKYTPIAQQISADEYIPPIMS